MRKTRYTALFVNVFITLMLMASSNNTAACDSTAIIAHRGASALAPENTISAFQLAIDIGVDYFELDVMKSSDDSLMVIHDATVDRTTNGTGAVNAMTYAQLRALVADNNFGPAFAGEKIPTLHEALVLARNNGVKVCVEMKEPGIEAAVVNTIQNTNMTNGVVVFSFTFSELQTIKSIDPSLKICFLGGGLNQTDILNVNAIGGEYMGYGGVPSLVDIEFARALGIGYFAWTINNPDDMLRLMSKGIAGIITDNPQTVKGLKTYMGIGDGGLRAYWDFDEGTGSILYDSSGHVNHASTNNISWTGGYSGLSASFDGASSLANIPTSITLDISGQTVSISAWVKLNVLPGNMPGAYGPIFDSDQDSYILYLDKGSSELRFKISDDDIDIARPGIPQALLTTGNWLHVVGVYNSDEVLIYLNGLLVDYDTNGSLDNLLTGQVPQFGHNNGYYFDGNLDEFKIYDRALSRNEVEHMYLDESLNCSNLASEEIDLFSIGVSTNLDTVLCDTVQLNFDILDIPRVVIEFDGVTDYVDLNAAVPQLTGNSHSFFGWFRTTNPGLDERIFSINGEPAVGTNVSLFGVNNGLLDVFNGTNYTGSTLINDGNWHFLGYSWNQATQQLQLWVDGVLDGNFTANLAISGTDLASLGHEFDGLTISNQYNGSMAEVTLWNTALSGPEISQIMLNPITNTGPNYANLVGYYNVQSGCVWELKDRSSYGNDGVSCSLIDYSHDILPGFNSTDHSVSWTSDVLGQLSSNQLVSFQPIVSQVLVFNSDNGYGTVYVDTVFITVANCTGIESYENGLVSVYPNPTTDKLQIECETMEKVVVDILTLDGQRLQSHTFNDNKTIWLGELAGGVYILRFTSGSQTVVKRLVKQ